MNELKEILLKTGNPFVWMNDAGQWWFHEQPNTTMFTAAEILGEVIETPVEVPVIEKPEVKAEKIKSQRKK